THALADHEPIGQRSVIVAAMRVDGKVIAAGMHQQHVLVADMAEQHVVLEIAGRNTNGEIGACGCARIVSHVRFLPQPYMVMSTGSSRQTQSRAATIGS